MVLTHIYGVSKEMDGKMFIFRVNLGMWPLKLIILEKWALSEGFNTHLWGFQGDRWENIHFSGQPRHVTPQIDHIRKTNPVLMVTTHISGISKKIDVKTFIFRLNLGMWPLKLIVLEKRALFWEFHTHLCSFQADRWKNIHFSTKPSLVTPQIDHLGKRSPVLRVSAHIYGVSKEIDGKTFIFQVNLGMWPSNRSSQKNKPCSDS